MSTTRRALTSTPARLVWGGLIVVLVAGLVASFFLAGASVRSAESEAEREAVDRANTVLFDLLTPEQLQRRITGADYREVLAEIQAGILNDDHVMRVRIWNGGGGLVFSSDQRDEAGEVTVAGDELFTGALGGTAVSAVTGATVPARDGLAGSTEQLYVTYVPLRLADQPGVSGVVEVDQRYGTIRSGASGIWGTGRVVLAGLLALAVVMLIVSLVARPSTKGAAVGLAAAGSSSTRGEREALERATKAEAELAAAKERADKAEAELAAAKEHVLDEDEVPSTDETPLAELPETAGASDRIRELEERTAQAEKRAVAAESALQAAQRVAAGRAPRRGVPGVGTVAVAASGEEPSAKVRAAEAERDELFREVERLRAAIAQRDIEFAASREGGSSSEAEVEKLRDLLAEHERRAAEREQLTMDAVRRALDAEERVTELEARVAQAEADATRTATVEPPTVEPPTVKQREIEPAAMPYDLAREEVPAAVVGSPDGTIAASDDPSRLHELQARVEELEGLRRSEVAELQRAHESLANTQFEAARAARRVRELEEQLHGAGAPSEAAGARDERMVSSDRPVPVGQRAGLMVEQEVAAPPAPNGRPAGEPEPPYGGEPASRLGEPQRREPRPGEPRRREPSPEAEPRTEPEPELDEAALSLRERLARAAAARHRAPGG